MQIEKEYNHQHQHTSVVDMQLTADKFHSELLLPQDESELLLANSAAQRTVKQFFLDFQRFNDEYRRSPTTALLPKSTCLIVKGPPGCGKTQCVKFFMKQCGIAPDYQYSMALDSRNSDFISKKFNDTLHNTQVGSAVVLTNIDALSTNGKLSPSKKLLAFLDSPGMAATSRGARRLRDIASPETAQLVVEVAARIRDRHSRRRGKKIGHSAAKQIVTRNYDTESGLARGKRRTAKADRKTAVDVAKKGVSSEKNRFARNTKACVKRKNDEPSSLDALYRKYYPFTTHVPLILIANDHQHHSIFSEFRKLTDCTLVQFRQPPMDAISKRIAQIFLKYSVQTSKPKTSEQPYLVSEIAASSAGDVRKAMRMVAIGIQRSLRRAEQRSKENGQPPKQFVPFKRRLIGALFDRQLSAQNDHFTAVSFLALDCPDLTTALQHVARPRLAMVPQTIYESFFRLLPYAPAGEAYSNRQGKIRQLATKHSKTTLRNTKNSTKEFCVNRLKQKLFVQMLDLLDAKKQKKVMIGDEANSIGQQSRTVFHGDQQLAALNDSEFCENLIEQYFWNDDEQDANHRASSNTLNRAGEAVCRADFEEVFSCADLVTQEFCCRRSPILQQTWHDSAVAWAYMLRKAGDKFPIYGFQPQCCYTQTSPAQWSSSTDYLGIVQTRRICSGRNSKNTGPCIKNASHCTCRWLTTPSLKGSRGVRLQWFKSSVIERDIYDIKTGAFCQSSCDRFFYYTNYISCMEQVRKRGQMLVNLQDRNTQTKRRKTK